MDDQTTSVNKPDAMVDRDPVNSPEQAAVKDEGVPAGRMLVYAAVIAVFAAAALTLAFSSGAEDPADSAQAEGFDRFEDLVFVTIEGDSENLGAYAGEPLVVNFFASWCAPCRAEMPHFESASQTNGDAVKFLGINHDLEDSSWKAFVAETDVTFETVFQPGTEIWNELDAKGMPTTAFISPDGEVLHVYTGVLNEETLQSLIDQHLLETA